MECLNRTSNQLGLKRVYFKNTGIEMTAQMISGQNVGNKNSGTKVLCLQNEWAQKCTGTQLPI